MSEGMVMFLIISVVLTGLSLCLVIWTVSQPVLRRPFAAGAHGSHLLLNMVWPWVAALKPLCEPFISWRMRAHLTHHIRLAALGSAWEPADLMALQVVVFIASGVGSAAGLYVYGDLRLMHTFLLGGCAAALFSWLPRHALRHAGRRRQQQMLRELPFLLDMTTLCVEAGLTLHIALQRAAQYGPAGPLRHELHHALADIRAGMPRTDALGKMAERTDLSAVVALVAALRQADQLGSNLSPILRSQSDQRRSEQFLRAEERALKAPVKMLFPMVLCIFPCTFLIIGFPIAIKVFNGAW